MGNLLPLDTSDMTTLYIVILLEKNRKFGGMAAHCFELYYIIFLSSSKHDRFYFQIDYAAVNCIT